jgi:hypothetical protein
MKNEYSKINFPDLRIVKKIFKKGQKEYEKYLSILLKVLNDGKTSDRTLNRVKITLIHNICNGKYINYFIEDDIFNFLKNIPVRFDENFRSLLTDKFISKNIELSSDEINEISKNVVKADANAMLNFLDGIIYSKQIKRSYAFTIFTVTSEINNKDSFRLLLYITDGKDIQYMFNLSDNEITSKSKDELTFDVKDIFNVIVNMFYYMDAYPESILNVPPDEIIDKLNKNNSKTIGISDEIKPYLTREMMPHLRRGHFRYLGSEFYKNKRNQTVFIKPTFIHGDVKTIMSQGNIQ